MQQVFQQAPSSPMGQRLLVRLQLVTADSDSNLHQLFSQTTHGIAWEPFKTTGYGERRGGPRGPSPSLGGGAQVQPGSLGVSWVCKMRWRRCDS